MESSIFLSYAHADAGYAQRLSALLVAQGLPVWYDRHLSWGSRFPAEIRQRIQGAPAVIVLMSPAAQESEWVEREILEAQEHTRPLLPVLLAGRRLFLLAASHYFDARDGALPGEDEVRQLRRLVRPSERPGGLDLDGPAVPAPAVVEQVDPLLAKLGDLLEQGDLAHADILTTSLLLTASDHRGDGHCLEKGWMGREDGLLLSFGDLARVDAAWSGSSAGSQGFRAQLARQPAGPHWLEGYRGFSMLASALGWKLPGRRVTPPYGEFVAVDEPPVGFFPTLRNPQLETRSRWHDKWQLTALAVHRQLHRWEGQ